MTISHNQATDVEVEDRTATLTLDGAAEADQWLRDNGIKSCCQLLILGCNIIIFIIFRRLATGQRRGIGAKLFRFGNRRFGAVSASTTPRAQEEYSTFSQMDQ